MGVSIGSHNQCLKMLLTYTIIHMRITTKFYSAHFKVLHHDEYRPKTPNKLVYFKKNKDYLCSLDSRIYFNHLKHNIWSLKFKLSPENTIVPLQRMVFFFLNVRLIFLLRKQILSYRM
jgi:hypothetical protein